MARRRGFAAMSAEMRRECGRIGGLASVACGRGHRFDRDEAQVAGRKGGIAAQARGVAPRFTAETGRAAGRKGGLIVSMDREHMSRIGRTGGRLRGTRQIA